MRISNSAVSLIPQFTAIRPTHYGWGLLIRFGRERTGWSEGHSSKRCKLLSGVAMPPKKDAKKGAEDDGETMLPFCTTWDMQAQSLGFRDRLHPRQGLLRRPIIAVNRTEVILKNYKKVCA